MSLISDVVLGHQGQRRKEKARRKLVSFSSILLAMDAPSRRANVRVHVSKNHQPTNYPRGALIMVAGAGGGNQEDFE